MNRKATALVLGALVLGPFVGRADAGIVITKEGKVIIGRIVKDEITEEGNVKIHWPYKDRHERGTFIFEKNRIRWYDVESDEPSNEYWDKYANEPIDPAYLPLRDRYLDSKQRRLDPNLKLFLDSMRDSSPRARLSPQTFPFKMGNSEMTFRKPEGWNRDESVNGMLMLISDTKGEEGYLPRIHMWSIPSAPVQPSDQVTWMRDELIRIAGASDTYESRDEDGPKVKVGGHDYTIQTTIRRQGSKPITALRHIFFRTNRTYFFAAYAHEKDFEKYAMLFRMCLQSVTVNDGGDQKPADGSTGGDQKPGDAKPGDAKPGDAKPADGGDKKK